MEDTPKKKKPATDASDVDDMTEDECREALKQLLDEKRQREEALTRTIDSAPPFGSGQRQAPRQAQSTVTVLIPGRSASAGAEVGCTSGGLPVRAPAA